MILRGVLNTKLCQITNKQKMFCQKIEMGVLNLNKKIQRTWEKFNMYKKRNETLFMKNLNPGKVTITLIGESVNAHLGSISLNLIKSPTTRIHIYQNFQTHCLMKLLVVNFLDQTTHSRTL